MTEPMIPAQPVPVKKAVLGASIALIIILGFAVYANSLNGQFLFDDEILIRDNTSIRSPSGTTNYFTKDLIGSMNGGSSFYRPLQMITYALDYAFWNLNVTGYHLTNMLFHIFVALCVYWMINILYKNNKISLITAALFVVHPVHTESISYIASRANSLSALFMLLCFIIYIKQVDQDRTNISGYALLLLTYTLALFSKEMSIILPLLLLLYHFVFRKKIVILKFASLLGVLAIYVAIRLAFFKSTLPTSFAGSDTVFDRIPGFFVAILSYIKLLFLPFPLYMEHGSKLFGFTDSRAILGVIVTLTILAFACWKRSNKIVLFSVGWFFLTLLPVSNLYRINAYMAESFLYLPSIGFFLLIAYSLTILYNDKRYKALGLTLITASLLFYSAMTIKQNDYWKESFAFYDRTLKFAPGSIRTYNNRGIIYSRQGNYDMAISDYTRAIELKPDYTNAYNNRGLAYAKRGNYDEAILDCTKAIELRPDYTDAYNNRGVAYASQGNYGEAISDCTKAIELNPDFAKAYNNRGSVYSRQGNYDMAISDYTKAIELDRDFAEAYNNRGLEYANQGNYDEAVLNFTKAIALKPDYTEAYNNCGTAYFRQGNVSQAISYYTKAIELNPRYAPYFNLGIVYDQLGDALQAISYYTKAIETNPKHAEIYNNRSISYYKAKEYDNAWTDAHKAELLGYKVDPKFLENLKKSSGRDA